MRDRVQAVGQRSPRHHGKSPRLPYMPGLDGLRAIAVIAVLLYHADLGWLRGGFLGVEIFFVISGYLITRLLLVEWRQTGQVDLAQFWLRRARRLLPALYAVLVVTLAYAVLFLPRDVARLRGDALAAFGYVTNWYLIIREQSYFEAAGRPSPLLHLWSLAIEEQFYLLWPLVLAFALRRWPPRRIMIGAVTAVAVSTLLMALLYRPSIDPSAIYYRTDTRLGGLLVGAALAFVWQPEARPGRATRAHNTWYEVVGLGSLAALVVYCLAFDETMPFLYQGGFLLVAVTTAMAIAATIAPQGRGVAALLEWRPLRWAGTRSYSLYLWHWPVYVITRPRIDLAFDGLPLLALRLMVVGVLAELSYRCIERPIRRGALGQIRREIQAARGMPKLVFQVYLAAGVLLLALLGTAVVMARTPSQELPSAVMIDSPEQTEEPPATEEAATSTVAVPMPVAVGGDPSPPPVPTPLRGVPTAAPKPPTRAFIAASRVTAVGDSVMVGVADELDAAIKGQLYLDAAIGRQPEEGIAILEALRDRGRLGQVVIIHLGNNGYLTEEGIAAMMELLADVRLVVIINVRVPRDWEGPNNRLLARARQYPNAVLVDWYSLTNHHLEYFEDDGIHPNEIGRELYTRMVAKWANEPIIPAWRAEVARGNDDGDHPRWLAQPRRAADNQFHSPRMEVAARAAYYTDASEAAPGSLLRRVAPSRSAPARARSGGPVGVTTKVPAGVR